jgi:hypothetical protein
MFICPGKGLRGSWICWLRDQDIKDGGKEDGETVYRRCAIITNTESVHRKQKTGHRLDIYTQKDGIILRKCHT